MEDFRSLVCTKKNELESLWEDWVAVQQEIIDLGMNVLGAEAFETVVAVDGDKDAGARDKSDFSKEKERLMEEYDMESGKLEAAFSAMSRDMIQKMEASEKVC